MQKSLFILFILLSNIVSAQQRLTIFFDFNKDTPNEKSMIEINTWISKNNSVEIFKMIGYCDSVDNRNYNKELAMRRINSIKNSN